MDEGTPHTLREGDLSQRRPADVDLLRDDLSPALILCIGLGVAAVVLAMPAMAMMEGGYNWTEGLFFKHQVHAVARTGGRLSGALFAIGLIGLLAGLAWPRLALWIGAATRLRVLAVYGGMIVLALACRIETIALLKVVHAREDQAVRALYERANGGMTIAAVQALANTFNRDLQMRPADMGVYDGILDVARGGGRTCTIEFSAPERYAGARLVAQMASCERDPDARIGRLFLVAGKHQVATK